MKELRNRPLETTDVRADLGLIRPGADPSAIDPAQALTGGIATRGSSVGVRLANVFKSRAEALGMCVRETCRSELRRVIDELVAHYGPAVIAPSLIATFPELDGVGDSTPDDPRLSIAACGVTGVAYAVAETGSIVLASGGSRWRQFSSVPPVHIAVIERRRLVPDLLDILLASGGRHLPPGFVVLTGPGRTSDADTLRAHRPTTVECVLVD